MSLSAALRHGAVFGALNGAIMFAQDHGFETVDVLVGAGAGAVGGAVLMMALAAFYNLLVR